MKLLIWTNWLNQNQHFDKALIVTNDNDDDQNITFADHFKSTSTFNLSEDYGQRKEKLNRTQDFLELNTSPNNKNFTTVVITKWLSFDVVLLIYHSAWIYRSKLGTLWNRKICMRVTSFLREPFT